MKLIIWIYDEVFGSIYSFMPTRGERNSLALALNIFIGPVKPQDRQ